MFRTGQRSDQRTNLHVVNGCEQTGVVRAVQEHEYFADVVAGWIPSDVLIVDAGKSGAVRDGPEWKPAEADHIFVAGREHFASVESENRGNGGIRERSRRGAAIVFDELLAFSWRRPSGNYDIYIMDVASRSIREITRDAGRNERPSWAPDGRHIVFESTRRGSRQIWVMLADGSDPRQLTTAGHNESPNWSTK
jgi:dipeptidyl aminopeptidase/acylaminoacyl peptidase